MQPAPDQGVCNWDVIGSFRLMGRWSHFQITPPLMKLLLKVTVDTACLILLQQSRVTF